MNFLIVLSLFSIILSGQTFAKKKNVSAKDLKWNKLMKLIQKEEKVINTMKNLGPRLRYRLLELNSEKLKLITEKENDLFMGDSYKNRKKNSRNYYFRKSQKLYKETREKGLFITKKWPHFRNNASIYYTLALNSRDFDKGKETEYFLHKALKNANKRDSLVHLAKTSLAEFYYNNKKYKMSIKYYRDVLKNKNDEWYSKHLFNVGWCYFKVQNYNDAIESLKRSFEASKQENYIDMSEQIFLAIGTFYVMGDRIEEGTQFYIKNKKSPGEDLIKMAKKTADKGSFQQIRYILKVALNNSRDKDNIQEQIEINLAELDFYRNFKQEKLFFETSESLRKLNKIATFNLDQKEEAVQKIKSYVGYHQLRLSKNQKINNHEYDKNKLNSIILYFDILSSINHENEDQYKFYQGESYFSVLRYKDAIITYRKALDINKANKITKSHKKSNKKFQNKNKVIKNSDIEMPDVLKKIKNLDRKIMDSMLASLEKGQFSAKFKKNYTIYTYRNHLAIWPVHSISQVLYLKLFNLYMKDSKIKLSHKTLESYIKHYPTDRKLQREMFTQEMDYYIKNKKSDNIAFWIGKMEKGYIGIKNDYIEKATLILGHILFETFEKLEKDKKFEVAINGYKTLYNDKKYPRKIKARSSMKIAINFIELKQVDDSFIWLKKSLSHHEVNEAFSNRHKILAMIDRYAGLLNFKTASIASKSIVNQFCSRNYKLEEKFYDHAIHFNLLESQYEQALSDLELAKKCNIKNRSPEDTREKIILFAIKNRHYKTLFNLYRKFGKKQQYRNIFEKAIIEVYWDGRNVGKKSFYTSIKKLLKKEVSKGASTFIQEQYSYIDMIDRFLIKHQNPVDGAILAKAVFDEKNFNSQLEHKIKKISSLAEEAKVLIQTGHPELILAAYSKIILGHENAIKAINQYNPKGVSQDFVKSFKEQIGLLVKNLVKQKDQQIVLAKNIIKKNKIFSPMAYAFGPMRELASQIEWHYPSHGLSIPMDLIGAGGQHE